MWARLQSACLLVVASLLGACALVHQENTAPLIQVEDVQRFYAIFDAATGAPSAQILQRDYLEQGSSGLQTFARLRNITGEAIAASIERNPQLYERARRCADVLPAVRDRLQDALRRLKALYPAAKLPPVTIAVGRGKPVGVGAPDTGIQIGLEALCAVDYLNADVEDRFVYVITHEYIHVQQAPELAEATGLTVLELSLVEGIAEFVTELVAGEVAYSHLRALTAGREREIEEAFARDMDKTDVSDWLFNGTLETPGDLGYWVGYRIARAYYEHAPDKRAALRDMLEMTDARAFLAASGWHPGIALH
ncbi:MAG TPA: DUF2268 domain-containing putative Zn-dependent protease [Gammaproteobacteria bacterium]|nr:DUF2268 domain-containing putative Zn-dependent protease [Gammaproteobacteria bacterium]